MKKLVLIVAVAVAAISCGKKCDGKCEGKCEEKKCCQQEQKAPEQEAEPELTPEEQALLKALEEAGLVYEGESFFTNRCKPKKEATLLGRFSF